MSEPASESSTPSEPASESSTPSEPASESSTPSEKPPVPWEQWDAPTEDWMLPGTCPDASQRTLLLEISTRVLFPTVLVFSVYLLLVGHYGPGGGFAAGLVAGLAFVLRHIAGGGVGPPRRTRVRPPLLAGIGLAVAVLTALAPLAFGRQVLTSATLTVAVPLVGDLALVTSLFLDVGVYLLIIGVVLDLLRSLGSGIERDARDAGEAR